MSGLLAGQYANHLLFDGVHWSQLAGSHLGVEATSWGQACVLLLLFPFRGCPCSFGLELTAGQRPPQRRLLFCPQINRTGRQAAAQEWGRGCQRDSARGTAGADPALAGQRTQHTLPPLWVQQSGRCQLPFVQIRKLRCREKATGLRADRW